jgi:hypothetical protein
MVGECDALRRWRDILALNVPRRGSSVDDVAAVEILVVGVSVITPDADVELFFPCVYTL